jgi:hypothetical protein
MPPRTWRMNWSRGSLKGTGERVGAGVHRTLHWPTNWRATVAAAARVLNRIPSSLRGSSPFSLVVMRRACVVPGRLAFSKASRAAAIGTLHVFSNFAQNHRTL